MGKFKDLFKHINFKIILIRLLIFAVIIGVAFVPIYLIFRTVDSNLWDAFCSGDQHRIVDAVSQYDNKWGVIIVAILQIVQDWVIVIPSAPIHIAAGVILGTWQGFLVCHIADVASNMIVFLLYSKIKKEMDRVLPISSSSKTVRRIKEGKSPTYIVVITCLLPAVPNGIIPYAAVNAKMKLKDYMLAVIIGAAPPKIVLTAIGEQIFEGDWLLMIVLVLIALVGALLLMHYERQTVELFIRVKNFVTRGKTSKPDVRESSDTVSSERSATELEKRASDEVNSGKHCGSEDDRSYHG